jgi:hypothetical protein
VTAHSAGRSLGHFPADASGEISGDITLPAGLNPGVHKLTFLGTNHGTPRRIDVLARIDGRPAGADDYGFYVTGFDHDSSVSVSYGGLDWGSQTPNEEGGVFVEVPLPAPDHPGGVTVTLTGADSGRVVTHTIAPAPPAAGIWARGSAPDAISIDADGLGIDAWVHSDGGVKVRANGSSLTGGVEYATTYTQSGNGLKVAPDPVQVAAGGSPLTVDVAAWRPGGSRATALGSGYRAVPSSACANGRWTPAKSDLGAAVTYVPCAVTLDKAIAGAGALVADGPITVSGSGVHLDATAQGFDLASSDAITVTGSGFQTAAAIWAQRGVSLSGRGAKLACGIYADTVSLTGAGTKISACT